MSNYLTNIYQTLRDHTKYFDITRLLPLMLCTAEMTYEYELLQWVKSDIIMLIESIPRKSIETGIFCQ